MPRFSLVVPFYQEAGNVLPLMGHAREVLGPLEGGFEAILVDDGSTDSTASELEAVAAADPSIRVIRMGRNAGQAFALRRGLWEARGEVILTMDGDGQNDPRDFPELIALLDRGEADLVCGWRSTRYDPWVRKIVSRVGNALRRHILRDGVHDSGCQLRAFRREVIAALLPTRMMQSFLPAMAAAGGFRVREVRVRHHPRRHGASKYGPWNLVLLPLIEVARVWWLLRLSARRAGQQPRSRP